MKFFCTSINNNGNRCESIYDDKEVCPTCNGIDRKHYETKQRYAEYDEITGNEISVLSVVHGDIDDI